MSLLDHGRSLVLCLDKAEYIRKPTMCVKKLPIYVDSRFADLDLPVGTLDLHTCRLLDYTCTFFRNEGRRRFIS